MHALNSIKDDLEVTVEKKADYEIHRFFYKGLQLRQVYWRPTAIYQQDKCDFCVIGLCQVCRHNAFSRVNEQRRKSSLVDLKIDSYCDKLFNRKERPFECIDCGYHIELYLQNIQILDITMEWFKWSFDKIWIGSNRTTHFEIHDDRLVIHRKKQDPLIFYKAIPLHREILTELRKFRPFDDAPVWL